MLVALLQTMSGIERNPPGTVALNLSCINSNSIVQKGALIIDLIQNCSLDALAIYETKLVQDDPPAIK